MKINIDFVNNRLDDLHGNPDDDVVGVIKDCVHDLYLKDFNDDSIVRLLMFSSNFTLNPKMIREAIGKEKEEKSS